MAYDNVRNAPEFNYSNRTLGGGQWDSNLHNSTDYPIPANYDYDQFGTDLGSGDVGNLNFVIPDQCDDMHGISGVTGSDADAGTTGVAAIDCTSVANNFTGSTGGTIITRGDNYVYYVVEKIKASALWQNPQKKVAIVLMFDEGNQQYAANDGGTGAAAYNSCCGWDPVPASIPNYPLMQADGGAWVQDTTLPNYSAGNHGHGNSIWGLLTNQTGAPKGVMDSDAYSHFSFVRTLQDMFALSDPANDATYANRSKYTEKFIAENILNLPEYSGSADTHFDAVRPMNHAFKIPASYTAKQSSDVTRTAQTGPDTSQTNIWATK
jgi:hypothetical protein